MWMLPTLLALAGLFPAGAWGAQAPAPSTGSVFGSPLRLQFRMDPVRGPQAHLGFSLRWDSEDLPGAPGRAARLILDPFTTAERATREALTGADIRLYSIRVRTSDILPVGILLSPLSLASSWLGTGALFDRERSRQEGARRAEASRQDRRYRLRLTPVYDEIQRNLKNEIRRGIITASFDYAVPQARGYSFSQKEALVEDLRKSREIIEEDLE